MSLSNFDVLPHELLVKILALVPFGSEQCCTLMLVCRKFRCVVGSVTYRMELARYQCPELLSLCQTTTLCRKRLKRKMSEENEAVSLAASLTKDSDNKALRQILLEGARLLNFLCLILECLDTFFDSSLDTGDHSPYRHTFFLIAREANPHSWSIVGKALRFTIWRLFDVLAEFQDGILGKSTSAASAHVEATDRLSEEERHALSSMFVRRSFEISILSISLCRVAIDSIRLRKSRPLVGLTRDMMDIFQELLDNGKHAAGRSETSYVACLRYLAKLPVWLEIGESSPSTDELTALEDTRIRNFFAAELAKDRKLERDITNTPELLLDEINKVELDALTSFLSNCLMGTLFVHDKLDELPLELLEDSAGGLDIEALHAMVRRVDSDS